MPTRSRTHQLEDLSIREFERLLPSAWISRRKDKDYGVDMEVELFDEFGKSTGLMFFVQLKATDNLSKERAVGMKVDRLEYLASLDAPSMVVRYCEPSDTFHWLWLPEIYARNPPPKAKTMTIKFETTDVWGEGTVSGILPTLRTFRKLRTGSRRIPFGLEVHSDQANSHASFALDVAISNIVGVSPRFKIGSDPDNDLSLLISLNEETLRVSIDSIMSISIELDPTVQDEISQLLCYMVACLAYRSGFNEHFRDLANYIVHANLSCQCREFAAVVASGVVEDSELAAAVASINGIHEIQDDNYLRYIHALLSCPGSHDKKLLAFRRFYDEAIDAHSTRSDREQAVLHYSFGNSLRVAFEFVAAFKQFNLARRKYPGYLDKGYFLAELGATLYFLGRYRLSSEVYAAAHAIEASAQTAICAGDAYLFAGRPSKAQTFYNDAKGSNDEFEATEADIKSYVAGWLVEFLEHNKHGSPSRLSNPDFWTSIMQQSIEGDQVEHAFCASIILSYLMENDPVAWTNAIQFSLRLAMSDNDTSILVATLTCAVQRCGYEAYSEFRGILVTTECPIDIVHMFDQMAKSIHGDRLSVEPERPIMRFIAPPSLDLAEQ